MILFTLTDEESWHRVQPVLRLFIAENTAKRHFGFSDIVYVVGTEVPVLVVLLKEIRYR